jgi:voltage-gated potassium channel Kch
LFGGQFIAGVAIIIGSVAFHSCGFVGLLQLLIPQIKLQAQQFSYIRAFTVMAVAVLGIFILHAVVIIFWAYFFIYLGEFSEFGQALYFSMVTYTTLGYGDVTLSQDHQVISGLEAIDGIILFGVSTASLFAIFQRLLHR